MNDPAAAAPRERIVELDESATCNQHRYTYTRIARIGGYRIRARVERDFYPFQSGAVAEVLATDRTWTHLATYDPEEWIDATTMPNRGGVHCATELGEIAEVLLNRAASILLD